VLRKQQGSLATEASGTFDYYRLLESGFEAFARNWPEDFEARHGFLRKEVQNEVFSFFQYPEVPWYPDPPAPDF
jgi:hypothetical protein